MTVPRSDDAVPEFDDTQTTPEVGDEGGTPGDVEVGEGSSPGAGSEATETWRPTESNRDTVVRDETGEGRRSP